MASRPRTGCFAWTSPSSPCAKFQLTPRSASSTSRRLNAVSRRPRVDRPRVDPLLRCIELSATRSSSAIRARTKLTTFISQLCRGTARPVSHVRCGVCTHRSQRLRHQPRQDLIDLVSLETRQPITTCWCGVSVFGVGECGRRRWTRCVTVDPCHGMLQNCAGSSWSGMTRRVIFPPRGRRPLAQSPATLAVAGMVGASALTT